MEVLFRGVHDAAQGVGLSPEPVNGRALCGGHVHVVAVEVAEALPPCPITVTSIVRGVNVHSLAQVLPIHGLHLTVSFVVPRNALQL